ncbi:MAG: hypothetical protein ACM3ML_05390 [Micromonosporaceae bacterium]
MDTILVTHAGSLTRPAKSPSFLAAMERGGVFEKDAYAKCLRDAVTDVVCRQDEAGTFQSARARLASRELWGTAATRRH